MSVSAIRSPGVFGRFHATPVPTSPARLHPKEHGAYAILGVPLVVALFIVGITPSTALFTIATIVGFLAHEPMLIVTGCRGNRAREATPQAWRVLAVRLIVAGGCGLLAFSISSPLTRIGMLLCLIFAVGEFVVAATGNSRSLSGQLIGIAGLTLPSAVMLTAGGIVPEVAAQFWLIWLIGRVATTVAVRTAIVRHKSSATAGTSQICDLLLATAIGICCWRMFAGETQWLVTIPLLLSAVVLRTLIPHPRHLKQMGWSLLAVNVLSGALQLWIW